MRSKSFCLVLIVNMGGEYKPIISFAICILISWPSSVDTSPGLEVSIYHDSVWVSADPLCLELGHLLFN